MREIEKERERRVEGVGRDLTRKRDRPLLREKKVVCERL